MIVINATVSYFTWYIGIMGYIIFNDRNYFVILNTLLWIIRCGLEKVYL